LQLAPCSTELKRAVTLGELARSARIREDVMLTVMGELERDGLARRAGVRAWGPSERLLTDFAPAFAAMDRRAWRRLTVID
jgi:hypothetical protein